MADSVPIRTPIISTSPKIPTTAKMTGTSPRKSVTAPTARGIAGKLSRSSDPRRCAGSTKRTSGPGNRLSDTILWKSRWLIANTANLIRTRSTEWCGWRSGGFIRVTIGMWSTGGPETVGGAGSATGNRERGGWILNGRDGAGFRKHQRGRSVRPWRTLRGGHQQERLLSCVLESWVGLFLQAYIKENNILFGKPK